MGRTAGWVDARYAAALAVLAVPLTYLVTRPEWGPAVAAAGIGMLLALVVPHHWLPVVALHIVAVEPTLHEVVGLPSAVPKGAIICLATLAVVRGGLSPVRAPVVGYFAIWTAALAWSVLASADPYALGVVGMVISWAGFLSGWVFLLVRLDAGERTVVTRHLVRLPALVIGLGLLLWPLTGRSPLVADYSGVPRLQGLSIPPHLAMLAFAAVLVSLYTLRRTASRRPYLWVIANTAIATATLSRAAIAAIAVLLVFGFVLDRVPPERRGTRRASVAVLLAVGTVAIVGALQRTEGNAYEGPVNTSGRVQAWRFFLEVGDRAPWVGSGVGASAVANGVESPDDVQAAFFAPHNEFIHLYVDVGVLLGLAIVASLGVLLWTVLRRSTSALTTIGAIAGMVILASLDNPLSTPSVTLAFALALNVMSNAEEGNRDHEPAGRPRHYSPAASSQRMAVHRGSAEQLSSRPAPAGPHPGARERID